MGKGSQELSMAAFPSLGGDMVLNFCPLANF